MYHSFRKGQFELGFDRTTGVIKSIRHHSFPLEFAANEKNTPHIDVLDSRWLGDLILSVKKAGAIKRYATSLSGHYKAVNFSEKIEVVYDKLSGQDQKFVDAGLIQTFKINNDILQWGIVIRNNEKNSIEIGEFGIPFPVNNFYKGSLKRNYMKKG